MAGEGCFVSPYFLCHPPRHPIEPPMIHRAEPLLDRVDELLAKLSGPVVLTYYRRRRQPAGRYGPGPWS